MSIMATNGQQAGRRTRLEHARDSPLSAESVLDLFGRLGLRNTRPRRLIAMKLAELAHQNTEFAVQDFWNELQVLDPGIGRATVFRTVEVLIENGVLDRVPAGGGTHRYRVCGTAHHHHVRCSQCQRVVETDACIPAEMLAAVADATDFAIEGHSLELVGRCPDCQPT